MKYSFVTQFFIAVLLISSIFGCAQGGSGGGTGGQNSGNNKPLTPADCDRIWADYLRSHPQGQVTQYENKSTTVIGDFQMNSFTTRVKTTISENNGQRLIKLVETQNVNPPNGTTTNEEIVTKDTFSMCQTPTEQPQVPADIQTRTIGRESIKVRAGTFATIHQEMTMNMTAEEMNAVTVSNTWVSAELPDLLVKSKSETTSNMNGQPYKSITESELILFVK
jgi:hypothetical protein